MTFEEIEDKRAEILFKAMVILRELDEFDYGKTDDPARWQRLYDRTLALAKENEPVPLSES